MRASNQINWADVRPDFASVVRVYDTTKVDPSTSSQPLFIVKIARVQPRERIEPKFGVSRQREERLKAGGYTCGGCIVRPNVDE